MSDSNQNSTVTRRQVVKDGVTVTIAAGLLGTGTVAADGDGTTGEGDSKQTIEVGVVTDVSAAEVDEITTEESSVTPSGTTNTVGYYVQSEDALGTINWKWMNYTSWEYTGDELLWANSVGENKKVNKLWSFVGHEHEEEEYRENNDGVRVSALTTQVGEYDHPTDHSLPWVRVSVNGAGDHGMDEYGSSYWDDIQ